MKRTNSVRFKTHHIASLLQPKCLSANGKRKYDMCVCMYTHTIESYSALEKERKFYHLQQHG